MANYREMYRHLFQQTELAVRIIQQAQLECEDIFINSPEPELVVLEGPGERKPEAEPAPEPEEEKDPPPFRIDTDTPL